MLQESFPQLFCIGWLLVQDTDVVMNYSKELITFEYRNQTTLKLSLAGRTVPRS